MTPAGAQQPRYAPPPQRAASYEPRHYWEELLSRSFDASGVAYSYLAVSFNRAMYRAERDVVTRALRRVGTRPLGSALDIGSGTGMWLGFWRRFGISDITGVDLTEASISRLELAYSDVELVQADIGEPGLDLGRRFDHVSVMSVLLHIVDPARFSTALENLSRHLSPDGELILIEPVIVNGWWRGDYEPAWNSRVRTLAEWRRMLTEHGLELVEVRPVTFLLANPIDSRWHLTMRLWWRYWSYVLKLVGRRERLGAVVGRTLELLDRPLRRWLPAGPAAKLLVVRHHRTSSKSMPSDDTG